MTNDQASGKLWMWGVTGSIAVFILFFAGFAIWTYQSDVELIYDNYYDKDIVFEQQIRRVERTQALAEKPLVRYYHVGKRLMLKFPRGMAMKNPEGKVLLFRPSDLHKDRNFPLMLEGDTLQIIDLPNLDLGLWRVKLNWTSDGVEYYYERTFMAQ